MIANRDAGVTARRHPVPFVVFLVAPLVFFAVPWAVFFAVPWAVFLVVALVVPLVGPLVVFRVVFWVAAVVALAVVRSSTGLAGNHTALVALALATKEARRAAHLPLPARFFHRLLISVIHFFPPTWVPPSVVVELASAAPHGHQLPRAHSGGGYSKAVVPTRIRASSRAPLYQPPASPFTVGLLAPMTTAEW